MNFLMLKHLERSLGKQWRKNKKNILDRL